MNKLKNLIFLKKGFLLEFRLPEQEVQIPESPDIL